MQDEKRLIDANALLDRLIRIERGCLDIDGDFARGVRECQHAVISANTEKVDKEVSRMTEKEWAKKDYDYNKTRKELISALKKLDKDLQLSSSITGSESDALWCLILYLKSRYDYAALNWKILQKEGDEND